MKKINQLHTGTLAFESISPSTFQVLKTNYILFLEEVLGLTMETPENSDMLIDGLLSLYKEFKDQRKYDKVDEIRAKFKSMGLIIKDMKNSIDWGFEE